MTCLTAGEAEKLHGHRKTSLTATLGLKEVSCLEGQLGHLVPKAVSGLDCNGIELQPSKTLSLSAGHWMGLKVLKGCEDSVRH